MPLFFKDIFDGYRILAGSFSGTVKILFGVFWVAIVSEKKSANRLPVLCLYSLVSFKNNTDF